MPVYLRKNVNFTPQSMGDFADDNEGDFLVDPDQHRDALPQPYRMIDKTITRLLDDSWEIIASREQHRVEEAAKIRPPQYECAVAVPELNNTACLESTPDGQVVVIGLTNGLAALDVATNGMLGTWEQNDMHITQLHVSQMSSDIYMVSTICDLGMARVFALAGGRFYLLETVNEQEGSGKLLASKCESSSTGNFIGVYVERTKSNELEEEVEESGITDDDSEAPQATGGVLEIRKVPLDTWLKEIEALVAKTSPIKPAPSQDQLGLKPGTPVESEAALDQSDAAEGGAATGNAGHDEHPGSQPSSAKSKRGHRRRAGRMNTGPAGSPSPIPVVVNTSSDLEDRGSAVDKLTEAHDEYGADHQRTAERASLGVAHSHASIHPLPADNGKKPEEDFAVNVSVPSITSGKLQNAVITREIPGPADGSRQDMTAQNHVIDVREATVSPALGVQISDHETLIDDRCVQILDGRGVGEMRTHEPAASEDAKDAYVGRLSRVSEGQEGQLRSLEPASSPWLPTVGADAKELQQSISESRRNSLMSMEGSMPRSSLPSSAEARAGSGPGCGGMSHVDVASDSSSSTGRSRDNARKPVDKMSTVVIAGSPQTSRIHAREGDPQGIQVQESSAGLDTVMTDVKSSSLAPAVEKALHPSVAELRRRSLMSSPASSERNTSGSSLPSSAEARAGSGHGSGVESHGDLGSDSPASASYLTDVPGKPVGKMKTVIPAARSLNDSKLQHTSEANVQGNHVQGSSDRWHGGGDAVNNETRPSTGYKSPKSDPTEVETSRRDVPSENTSDVEVKPVAGKKSTFSTTSKVIEVTASRSSRKQRSTKYTQDDGKTQIKQIDYTVNHTKKFKEGGNTTESSDKANQRSLAGVSNASHTTRSSLTPSPSQRPEMGRSDSRSRSPSLSRNAKRADSRLSSASPSGSRDRSSSRQSRPASTIRKSSGGRRGSRLKVMRRESRRESVLSESSQKSRHDIRRVSETKSRHNSHCDSFQSESLSLVPEDEDSTPRGRTSPQAFKFTPSNVVLKVKPPAPVTGVVWSSPLALLKTVDNGDVIGMGVNHQLSQQHLEQRLEVFKNLHQQHWQFMPTEENTSRLPTFHFLTPGRMLPHGMDNAAVGGMGQATSVAVWWNNHNLVCHYALHKSTKATAASEETRPSASHSRAGLSRAERSGSRSIRKTSTFAKLANDLEHKPDVVWPQAATIVTSAVSACTSLIAVGLQGGTLIVWDKYIGMQRRVVRVCEETEIHQLAFLDASVCPQEVMAYPPYRTKTNMFILVWCTNGKLFLVNCGLGCTDPPQDVSAELEKECDNYTRVISLSGAPELVVTVRQSGELYLHNIMNGKVLCEVKLPETHVIQLPWDPTLAALSSGQMLYVRGTTKESLAEVEEGQEAPVPSHGVFVFQLRSFPTLDRFREIQRPDVPPVIHSTIERRAKAVLQERLSVQSLRKTEMQERWGLMKDELLAMKQARETGTVRPLTQFSVNSIERSILNSTSPGKGM